MISRLTACAACFAVISAATITFAAAAPDHAAAGASVTAAPFVHLPQIGVVGRRGDTQRR